MQELLKEVIKEITPSKDEHASELRIVREVKDLLKGYDAMPILVGSLEKNTDLRGNKDIDIFIQFRQSVSREDMEREGLRIGKTVFKKLKASYEIDYAEHPYVKGRYKGYDIEIVPCYTGKTIMTSVDRTPFHTKYVKEKIKRKPALSSEIRLLKRFMKAHEVYGAEAKVEGFSGYLAELLLIYYKSFAKVLEAASEWTIPEVIDVEGQWDDRDSLKYLFTQASLIVVDPVDKNRNVAAAVSGEKLAEFIVACEEFLKKPGMEHFFPKESAAKSVDELKATLESRKTKFIALVLTHKKLNENTLYGQLKKTLKSLEDEVEENEFKIFKSSFWSDENDTSVFLMEFEVYCLPEIKHHAGPPVDIDPENQEKFVEKYKDEKPYIKDGRWVVDTRRRISEAKQLLTDLAKSRKGFGKNLREAKQIRMLEDEKILGIKDESWMKHLTRYFS